MAVLTQDQRSTLAARLRRGRTAGRAAGPTVVTLNDGPPDRPLVLFHALGGTVFPYGHLARELTVDFRVLGVPAPHDERADDLDALVTQHLAVLRAAAGEGPYRLGGWSMGGILAFEIARRLGPGEVTSVALLDTPFWLPACDDPDEAEFAARFVADAARSLGSVPRRPDPRTVTVDEQLHWLAEQLDPRAAPGEMGPELRRRLAAFCTNTRVLAGYRPSGPLTADALVVDVDESPNSSRRWCEVLRGDVRTRSLAGTHYSFLQPPLVTAVAALLREGT